MKHRPHLELRDSLAKSRRPFRVACPCGRKGAWCRRSHGPEGAWARFARKYPGCLGTSGPTQVVA